MSAVKIFLQFHGDIKVLKFVKYQQCINLQYLLKIILKAISVGQFDLNTVMNM